MKHIKIFYFSLMLTGIGVGSCNKDKAPSRDVVYITAAEKSISTQLSVDNNGGETGITISASQPVQNDVTAIIGADTTLVSKYNQLTGKHYSPLPAGSYKLMTNTATIKKGTIYSDAVKFKVTSVADFKEGVSYLMPVTIKRSNGLPVLDASGTLYIVVNRTVIATVASLTNNYFTVNFGGKDELKALKTVTYEARVMVNRFQSYTPFISSVMGIEETFLFRFGDVTVNPNQLQLAGGLTAVNIAPEFATGVWYHLAGVYDGSQLRVYVNGTLVATKDAVRTIDLTNNYMGGFHFGYSSYGRYLDGAISEARVWSRALTPSEITNGMCGIDPASPGLVGYWKFNEGTGNVAHDISGNGNDAIGDGTVNWIPDVRCN